EARRKLDLSCIAPLEEWPLDAQPLADAGQHQPFARRPEHLRERRVLRERLRQRGARAIGYVVLDEDAPPPEAEARVAAHHLAIAVAGGPLQERRADDGPLVAEQVELGQRARSGFALARRLVAARRVHIGHHLMTLAPPRHLQLCRRVVVAEAIARLDVGAE